MTEKVNNIPIKLNLLGVVFVKGLEYHGFHESSEDAKFYFALIYGKYDKDLSAIVYDVRHSNNTELTITK